MFSQKVHSFFKIAFCFRSQLWFILFYEKQAKEVLHIMHEKRQWAALTAASLLLSLGITICGCNGKGGKDSTEQHPPSTAGVSGSELIPSEGDASATAEPETAPQYSMAEAPVSGGYEATSETVILLGDVITVTGAGAITDGATVTVTDAGTYLVRGTLGNGQLVVDTTEEAAVILILDGASVTNRDGPALLIRSAPKKVVLSSATGSVNIFSDGGQYTIPDEEQDEGEIYPNACIYSCEDLEFDGAGEICIRGNVEKGINTKDDLKIKNGSVTICAADVGIRANDSFRMSGGTVTVISGGDGVKTANTETEGKGFCTVTGGSLFVTAKGDGLSAATDLTISGGNLVLTTTDTDGEVLVPFEGNPTSSAGGFGGGPGGGFGMTEGNRDKASISAKGLKAAGVLTVSGGHITIVACDDGIHSDTDVHLSDGTVYVRAADDGVHAEKDLTVSGGILTVAQSFEGLEALRINVLGGTNRITASDDGANATNGEGGGFGGGPGGPGGFPGGGRPRSGGSTTATSTSTDIPTLTFAGGYSVFDAGGDGIDSNGNIVVTGGTVIVYGPTDNGNGPIDSGDGAYGMTISGGILLAVGSSGMAEAAENAGQAVLAASWRSGGLSAGETLGITDANGTVLAAFQLPKAISSIVFSSPALISGETYTIVGRGHAAEDGTDGVLDPATYTGFASMGEIQAY